jgi:hypothetical protein
MRKKHNVAESNGDEDLLVEYKCEHRAETIAIDQISTLYVDLESILLACLVFVLTQLEYPRSFGCRCRYIFPKLEG